MYSDNSFQVAILEAKRGFQEVSEGVLTISDELLAPGGGRSACS